MTRAALVAAALLLGACGHEGERLSDDSTSAPHASPPPAPSNPHGADPHAGVRPSPPLTAGVSPVAWTVPTSWKESPPMAGMRLAQFDVGADASGEKVRCIVYGGIGGSDEDNLARWVGQMGKDAKASAVVAHSDHDGVKVTRIEVRGPYTDAMRPGEPKAVADATMYGAIVETAAGKVHVKLVGPKTVVDPAAKAFDDFLASLRPK